MDDKDIYYRSKISYNFISDFNDIMDRQFEIYKENLIKEIIKELNEKILKNINTDNNNNIINGSNRN
tara:strand:+ start:453 stop:653 length:201 start_codon:yes stop_codon:yes gene_type:complete